jgi:hypothetical protein
MKCCRNQMTLFLAIALALTPLRGKNAPINRIPNEQVPLRLVIKPSQAELAPPGTEKCVIFTRESIGGENDWDFVAGAWEFIPSRPAAGVMKRAEFARSSWAAALALDDDLKIDGPARNLVRLQVDDSRLKFGYRPHLYRIDFRTWDVVFLGESTFSFVVGGNSDTLLMAGAQGIIPWKVQTASAVTGATPFLMLLEQKGMDLWLIQQKLKDGDAVWSYRPSRLEYVAKLPWFTRPWEGKHKLVARMVREDGTAWSIVTIDEPPKGSNGQEAEGGVNGSVWLAEAGGKELQSWPVRLRARRGSGVGWIPLGVELWFQGNQLCFQSEWTDEKKQSVIRQWTVDLPAGTVRESIVDKRHEPAPDPELMSIRIPEAFHPKPNDAYTSEKYMLAAYFLKSKGLIKKMPQYANCRAGFTPDLRRFVWKTQPRYRSNPFGSQTEDIALPPPTILLYGDLDKGTVLEVPCPPELVNDNALEIEWVIAR